MGCVYVTYLLLTNSIFLPYLEAKMNYFEARLMVFSPKNGLQSTQDGNLVKVI